MLEAAAARQEAKANETYAMLFQSAGVRVDRVPTFCEELEVHEGLLLNHADTGHWVFHRCRGWWWGRRANEEIADALRDGAPKDKDRLVVLFMLAGVSGLTPQRVAKPNRWKPQRDVLALAQSMMP